LTESYLKILQIYLMFVERHAKFSYSQVCYKENTSDIELLKHEAAY